MATKLSDVIFGTFPDLRYQPTPKRVRAMLGGNTAVDTLHALLVWEPKRVTPVYAVPETELRASLAPPGQEPGDVPELSVRLGVEGPPALDPRTGFDRHTAEGEAFDVVTPNGRLPRAAFRPADPDLAGYVVLDFDAFQWREDDEEIIGHPRDPFHRVDIRASSLTVEIGLGDAILATTNGAQLLYETLLPVRYYLPASDVRMDLLEASDKKTVCPYKGTASYFTYPHAENGRDIAWMYDQRFRDAAQIHGLVCFFNERVDITVDGVRQERPVTPWSSPAH